VEVATWGPQELWLSRGLDMVTRPKEEAGHGEGIPLAPVSAVIFSIASSTTFLE
jgi:hypothetical protein